jgi:hypothetical protein
MKSSTGLTLAAIGAILAFAEHGHPPGLDINAVGWVLLLVGIIGIIVPPGSHRWIRQRLIMRDGTYGPAFEISDAEYNPQLMPSGVLVPDGNDVQSTGAAFEETIVEETAPE